MDANGDTAVMPAVTDAAASGVRVRVGDQVLIRDEAGVLQRGEVREICDVPPVNGYPLVNVRVVGAFGPTGGHVILRNCAYGIGPGQWSFDEVAAGQA